MKNNKFIRIIIIIMVVGLLSLVPYFMTKDHYEEKLVTPKDEFKIGKMIYQIPADFEYTLEREDDNYKNYNFFDDSTYCHINMQVHDCYDSYETGEDYIRKNVYITLSDEIETSSNEDWYTITIKEKEHSVVRKISAKEYKKDIYVLEYRFSDYANGEENESEAYKKCNTAYDFVFNSIGFEK